ncbi:hypothetical protein BN2475_190087 [Paraburkholderia ribeironis]|uniref:Uncharacterized protein n=1 Tax=Paraburkholderia ribeironis TaxID=1247936 RepID=A0A1N7RVM7_9BURK|nr:hypothetical protein BN2475_190087 [Paraburkholderia ribeironis]
MSDSAFFKPRVIEPVALNQPEGLGLAVELWLAQPVDGIAGRALQIHLRSGTKDATGRGAARSVACTRDGARGELNAARCACRRGPHVASSRRRIFPPRIASFSR